MSFCNIKSSKSVAEEEDYDEDFIIDKNFSSDYYYDGDYSGFGRTNSSSSSIKWSVDARKQNEDDWLTIERVLYGEEDQNQLDEKTREEFQSWMKAFPHLRVVGKKIEVPVRNQGRNPIEFYEEILAIDPPERDSFKLLDQELNEKLSLRRNRQQSAKYQQKNDSLDKLLRITSSGLSGRNPSGYNQRVVPQQARKYVDKTSTIILKQNSQGFNRLSGIQEQQQREALSYSATSRPPLVKFLFKKPERALLDENPKIKSASSKLPIYELRSLESHKHEPSSKSATMQHAKNINLILLPPFSSHYDYDFREIIQGRSIQSAAFNGKTISKH